MIIIIISVIALIIGLICGWYFTNKQLKPQLLEIREYNKGIEKKNNELHEELVNLSIQKEQVNGQLEKLVAKRDEVSKSIDLLRIQAQESANVFYEQSMSIANKSFETSMEEARQKYLTAEEEYKAEYETIINEQAIQFQKQIEDKLNELQTLDDQIKDLRSAVESAVSAAKRAEELKTQADFYKIQLSDIDIQEIEMLRNVAPYLRDKEPLNKVIWKVYYEKPTTDLIGRVIGSGAHTGIYKITNLQNDMCYIGQAADLAARWKQHIKRGIGAEAPTRNKLYPAMIAIGVENFSFEVVEECDRSLLDQREDYWQEYFKAKEFGYSIK